MENGCPTQLSKHSKLSHSSGFINGFTLKTGESLARKIQSVPIQTSFLLICLQILFIIWYWCLSLIWITKFFKLYFLRDYGCHIIIINMFASSFIFKFTMMFPAFLHRITNSAMGFNILLIECEKVSFYQCTQEAG